MKKIILFGIIIASGLLFSCSNDDDSDLTIREGKSELFATGGEEDVITPPPPKPKP